MKEIFENIWKLAWPYQDKRDYSGHAQTTLDYAVKLIELENGDEDNLAALIVNKIAKDSRYLCADGKNQLKITI